jgi:hypothetical protein
MGAPTGFVTDLVLLRNGYGDRVGTGVGFEGLGAE